MCSVRKYIKPTVFQIPITSFDKIFHNGGEIPEKIAQKVRKRGVVIVRNTIPIDEISEYHSDLIKYLYNNNGFPKDDNQVSFSIYLYLHKSAILIDIFFLDSL